MFDRAVLAIHCSAWSTWIEALTRLREDGMTVASPSGYTLPSPWLSIYNRATDVLLKTGDQLGFSPAARGKIFNIDMRERLLLRPPPADDDFMPMPS